MSKKKIQKCLGCRGAKELIRSLENPDSYWAVSATPTLSPFGVQLERVDGPDGIDGVVKVIIFPNERRPCIRMFDNLRILVEGVDYYVGPCKRLKIRRAARNRANWTNRYLI